MRNYISKLSTSLFNDEAGFIVSGELILISTIVVLGLLVGLSELALNLCSEMDDVGAAFGHLNQGYAVSGLVGHAGETVDKVFDDKANFCSEESSIFCRR